MSLRRSRRALSSSSLRPLPTQTLPSQPTVRVVQPSPRINNVRPQNSRAQTQPIPMANVDVNENIICPICSIDVTDNADERALICDRCQTWYHSDCLYMSQNEYLNLHNSSDDWFCDHCKSIRANMIKWGCLEGETNIASVINDAYKVITSWRKNIFTLPRGKCGTNFIKELTRLIYLFVDRTKWERLSLPLVNIFVPLMLQKPGPKSKARDHAKYLAARLGKWSRGEIESLLSECKEIQKRLIQKKILKAESKMKSFCRLMLVGKVGQASKLINNDDCVSGVHKLTDDIKIALARKHPKAEPMHPNVMLPVTRPSPNPVIYEQITAEVIQKASRELKGSGGPTLVDADTWRHFLCSRAYGKQPYNLAEAFPVLLSGYAPTKSIQIVYMVLFLVC